MQIAITGGIGAGKSYVCRLLEKRGINVYDCDAAAKRLMRTSTPLQQQLQELIGNDVYRDGSLQKSVLAQFLLASEENKQAVNDIVHPAVAKDFEDSDYTWLESAILFDSRFNERTHFDYIICVTAPLEVRITRIMQRDNISREKTLEWINRQLPQEEVVRMSNFEIVNDGLQPLTPQVNRLINTVNSINIKS
ncbi:MAG: dephospho-CoA kinase [Prevotella sp.]|nr:dephospho-CoA kinase [Prevotella sp.]MBQ9533500.1 dephospho-CoA kinase [Prevotella sp.]